MTSTRTLGRGYMRITIRERGPIRRGHKAAFNAASKRAWFDTIKYFHAQMREKRFTESHARAAGYIKQKGEGLPRETKAFRKSYTGRKLSSKKHTRPLEFSGETRQSMRRRANVTSTSKSGKVAYGGARKFNFRHPRSRIRMNEEFRTLLPEEVTILAEVYDAALDGYWTEEVTGDSTAGSSDWSN